LCGSGSEEDAAAQQLIVAAMDGGAEGAAIMAACVVATVVGDNDEPVGSDVYNPINVAARQRDRASSCSVLDHLMAVPP
jgi:hypothetical protein